LKFSVWQSRYRAAQFEAGIIGGRLYLAAYAQRLGATGLTWYRESLGGGQPKSV